MSHSVGFVSRVVFGVVRLHLFNDRGLKMKRYTLEQIEKNDHQNWLATRKMSAAAISRKLCLQYFEQVKRYPDDRPSADGYKRQKQRYRRLIEQCKNEKD